MAKIKGWTKKKRNSNGDQWYENDANPRFMVGIVYVNKGTRKGEWLVWILNVRFAQQSMNITYEDTFAEASKKAVAFMRRNTIVKTI